MSALQYTAPDQTHHSVTMQPNSLFLDTDSHGLTLVQPVIDYLEPNGAPMQLALNGTQLVHISVYLGSQPTTDRVLQYIDWDGKWRVAESVPIVPSPLVHMRNISRLTYNGTYISAVNGGGLGGTPTYGVALQTDHTVASTWETFQLQFTDQTRRQFTLRASDGLQVPATYGGGRGGAFDARSSMHTNARTKGRWETFTLNVNVVSNATMLQTLNGNDVTEVNGGGIGTMYSVPFNTSRRQPGTWEVFTLAG